jgi:hypothetical protein
LIVCPRPVREIPIMSRTLASHAGLSSPRFRRKRVRWLGERRPLGPTRACLRRSRRRGDTPLALRVAWFRPYVSHTVGPMSEQLPRRVCPRCGEPVARRAIGRPAVWCSQVCRRAAYEERRAASGGAVSVRVVERVKAVDHDLRACAARVIDSPAASRRVLQAMASLAHDGTLSNSSKWSGTVIAANRLGAELEGTAAPERTSSVAVFRSSARPPEAAHGCLLPAGRPSRSKTGSGHAQPLGSDGYVRKPESTITRLSAH